MLIPVLRRPRVSLSYTQRLLATQPASLLAVWPLAEAAPTPPDPMPAADNAEGTAARDGAYSATGVTLGEPGIGDGGTAPSFDGVTSTVDISSPSLSAAIDLDEGTFAVWAKVANVGVWTDGLTECMMYYARAGADNVIAIQKFHPNILHFVRVGAAAGGVVEVQVAGQSSIGWMHLALTWSVSGNILRPYINGVATPTASGLVASDIAPIAGAVGSIQPLDSQNFPGWLALPALWSTPLSAAEVAALATV